MSKFVNPLLSAEEAKAAPPDKREQWVNAARDILTRETQEQISARPIEDRLSLAAASYGFWLQHIGNPPFEEGEWAKLKGMTRALPDDTKEKFADDLGLQIKALKSLTVDPAYFRMQDRILDRAMQLFMEEPGVAGTLAAWGKVAEGQLLQKGTGLLAKDSMITIDLTRTMSLGELQAMDKAGTDHANGIPHEVMSDTARAALDAAGVTHDKVTHIMNVASIAVNKAWSEEMERHGISDTPKPMRVEQATVAEISVEFNVQRDKDGSYYKVGQHSAGVIDPRNAMHVAFHEPQHQIQDRIGEMLKNGDNLPKYMQDASRIFRLRGNFGAKNCPPDILEVNERAFGLARETYAYSRGEETALYQGHRAAIEINRRFMPDTPPKMDNWRKDAPELDNGMPEASKKWAEGFGTKKTVVHPDAPKVQAAVLKS